jgi:hypothetical protein
MSINTITSDYTGRKKDISILQYPNPAFSEPQNVFPSFSKTGRFCTGVQKLIQKYTILLLTNLGSQKDYPLFGTTFVQDVIFKSGALDKILATQLFVLANSAVIRAIKSYQITRDDIPEDERLSTVRLNDVVFNNITINGKTQRQVGFDIKIDTEAGDSVDYVLPLPK